MNATVKEWYLFCGCCCLSPFTQHTSTRNICSKSSTAFGSSCAISGGINQCITKPSSFKCGLILQSSYTALFITSNGAGNIGMSRVCIKDSGLRSQGVPFHRRSKMLFSDKFFTVKNICTFAEKVKSLPRLFGM